ncbi:Alpha-D-glucose-1-phosphate phosphatase YihX [Thalassovita gelatinovora]|uniref:Alpha-D-glucose-1-phosphate phosphatase YihX n=1 Tax=Thalassovita gelatinovora TaxID=53501 RepID=A0A0N7LV45_THAGE|nr:HAD family phosphatase [Thalassovita gelatinovora]QIZ80693.1 HAD family phosphatase [Thalassovita gelatinovora]CUH65274.1 Alpha-D-glucose-1-phosphate phosphatase YihX [Thalassovita gelatinovora]SEQ88648.1 2-haloacid dehalogenase [Thalassovita gelatinovora]
MTPKAVVFDIGRVLIEYDPERFYDRVIGPERRAALFGAVDLHGINLRVDRGEPLHDTVAEAVRAHPEFGQEIAMWADRWIEMASPEIPHSVRLLEALKAQGVPVLALTNFGAETFEMARRHYPFLDLFDQRYVSADLKEIKPDPGIYAALEQGSGFTAKDLLFTDDKPENIEAARQRGWRVHLFEHPQGWADCLVGHGILTKENAA